MYIQHFGSTRLSQDSVLSVSHEGQVLQGNCENVAMMGPLYYAPATNQSVFTFPRRARRQKVLTDATYALSTQCETCARH